MKYTITVISKTEHDDIVANLKNTGRIDVGAYVTMFFYSDRSYAAVSNDQREITIYGIGNKILAAFETS